MKKKLLVILIFLAIFTISLITIFLFMPKASLKLVGDKKIVINYGESYKDEGVEAKYKGKNIKEKVLVKNNIDYNNLGTYYIEYELNFKWYYKKIKRIVEIVDLEAPTINLKGEEPFYIVYGKEYQEPGFNVKDNYDNDLQVIISNQDKIDSKVPGKYSIQYEVSDSSGNKTIVNRDVLVEDRIVNRDGFTYVEGILIVNKKYSIPKDYANGVDQEANNQLKNLQSSAKKEGITINLCSGYRSYERQTIIYNNYVKKHGQALADTFSARPGHSEHQTGLAFDVGKIDDNFGDTKEGKWLADNAHKFGFIIRYPKNKQAITGYKYEPWHIRYLGIEVATKVYESGLCLEEYLNI